MGASVIADTWRQRVRPPVVSRSGQPFAFCDLRLPPGPVKGDTAHGDREEPRDGAHRSLVAAERVARQSQAFRHLRLREPELAADPPQLAAGHSSRKGYYRFGGSTNLGGTDARSASRQNGS